MFLCEFDVNTYHLDTEDYPCNLLHKPRYVACFKKKQYVSGGQLTRSLTLKSGCEIYPFYRYIKGTYIVRATVDYEKNMYEVMNVVPSRFWNARSYLHVFCKRLKDNVFTDEDVLYYKCEICGDECSAIYHCDMTKWVCYLCIVTMYVNRKKREFNNYN